MEGDKEGGGRGAWGSRGLTKGALSFVQGHKNGEQHVMDVGDVNEVAGPDHLVYVAAVEALEHHSSAHALLCLDCRAHSHEPCA